MREGTHDGDDRGEKRGVDMVRVLEKATGILGPYYFVGRGPQLKALTLDDSKRQSRTEFSATEERSGATITRTVIEKWDRAERKTVVVVEGQDVVGVEQNYFDSRQDGDYIRVVTYEGMLAERKVPGARFVQDVYCGPDDADELLFAAGISPEETDMINKARQEGRRFHATKVVMADGSVISHSVELTRQKKVSGK